MRADIFVLFLILVESIQSFTINYDISCGFFINALYQAKEVTIRYFQTEFCILVINQG